MATQVPDQSEQPCAALQARLAAAEADVGLLRHELAEAREQQVATANIVRAIASAPTEVQPVLDAIAASASRLGRGARVQIIILEGGVGRVVAGIGEGTGEYKYYEVGTPIDLSLHMPGNIAIREARTIHIPDRSTDAFRAEFPAAMSTPTTTLHVPLIRNGQGIGNITVHREVAEPFSDHDIALLETFADQAVIAIENARLFQELERRNHALGEALERQTATAEILQVIAASPTSAQPVLDAVAQSAMRLSGSTSASVGVRVGDELHVRASVNSWIELGHVTVLSPATVPGRALLERRTIHIPDRTDPAVVAEFPRLTQRVAVSTVTVPLIHDGQAIGGLLVGRDRAQPYSADEIALIETFAAQAAIALANARLFEELRDRTAELAEFNRTLEARVGEQVEQLERVGRLRRYLSPQLAELIVSSGDESILASHRRRITVVFCDLRGFTAFAETEEPEEVMGVLGEYHAAMGELIRQHEGTFGHFAGDGLMIFFNDPLPQPDHVERAVRMACAMRERAGELARGWRRAGYDLGFGIGIAVGYATLGRIGFEGRYDYDVIGTVANLAARLCAEAADGQILIPARLHGMVENLVEAETIGELMLKGLHRPVEAFNVTGLRADGSPPSDQTTEQAGADP